MKKIIILLFALLLLGVTAEAQKINREFTTDTVKGAETIYFSGANPIFNYNGIAGYSFELTSVDDTLLTLNIQGAYTSDFSGAVIITGDGQLTGESAAQSKAADKGYFLFDTPPKYKYYRLSASCAATDTVIFTNVRLIYKEE